MALPRNVQVTPSLADLRTGKAGRPEQIELTTTVSGLFGPMTNTTVWLTQYDHEVEDFREDIVFHRGWLNTGRRLEQVMPWDVAVSHIRTISLVGGVLFKRKRYTMYRLYGSRNSYMDVVYSVKATDPEGKVYSTLLDKREDAALWRTLVRAVQKHKLGELEMAELKPKAARVIFCPTQGPARAIDLARENSLRLKYQLFRLTLDTARGDRARSVIESLDINGQKVIQGWAELVWYGVTDEDCPIVWK